MTPKQERFVAEYLIDLNATQAAIRAGYSEKTARSIASELLTKPDIAAVVAQGNKALIAGAVGDINEPEEGSAAWVVSQAVKVVKDGAGDRVAALSLLAKRLPEFSDKHDIEAKVGVLMVRQTRGLNA